MRIGVLADTTIMSVQRIRHIITSVMTGHAGLPLGQSLRDRPLMMVQMRIIQIEH